MGLGVFRSTKIALAFGTVPEPSYLQRSQQANNNKSNLKQMTSNAEFNIMQSQMMLENQRQYKEKMKQVIKQDD